MSDPSTSWMSDHLPDLSGSRALVTGVTAGLGTRTAAALARQGAQVLLAARSPEKLETTTAEIAEAVPGADLVPLRLDLADLSSVRSAAADAAGLGPLDLLVNNAGVMAVPFSRTADGFEMQLGTNHLGHFALTGLLLDALAASGDGRVVTVASQAHRLTRTAPGDVPFTQEDGYRRWSAYSRSKLANLMFTFALDRRCRAAGLPVRALAAHPGYSATELMTGALGARGDSLVGRGVMTAFTYLGQPAELGALPTLMAATADLEGATYVGPAGPAEFRGLPQVVTARRLAYDEAAQERLWRASEEATGVAFP